MLTKLWLNLADTFNATERTADVAVILGQKGQRSIKGHRARVSVSKSCTL